MKGTHDRHKQSPFPLNFWDAHRINKIFPGKRSAL